jgi:hypothetical protein
VYSVCLVGQPAAHCIYYICKDSSIWHQNLSYVRITAVNITVAQVNGLTNWPNDVEAYHEYIFIVDFLCSLFIFIALFICD